MVFNTFDLPLDTTKVKQDSFQAWPQEAYRPRRVVGWRGGTGYPSQTYSQGRGRGGAGEVGRVPVRPVASGGG